MLHFYYDLASQPCRALYMFLELSKIPYERKLVALRKGEHFAPEYGKINPFHKVPVVDDDGFKLTETVAIFRYLCDKHDVNESWYPKDREQRARVDEFMAWQHMNIRFNTASVFVKAFIEPMMTGVPANEKQVAKCKVKMDASLDQLENIFLKNQDYIAGSHLTFADLLCICEIMQVYANDLDISLSPRPRLQAWMARVKRDVGHQLFDEAHSAITLMRENYLKKTKSAL